MIIAELSANHAQDLQKAQALVEAAHEAGADAVKVQTYTPDTITFNSTQACFRIKDQALWKGKILWELYQEAYTPWEWQPELKAKSEALGMKFVASVFDPTSVVFWEQHGLEIYKIASAELVDIPLLQQVAATGKRMILSTGMGTIDEISEAVSAIEMVHPEVDLTLLKCSSAYPAVPEDMHLSGIKTLADTFGYPVGLSDHTTSVESAVVAVGLGATCFEKHLKLENDASSLDSAFSLTPDQFKNWARSIRTAQKTLGNPDLAPTASEQATLPFRKSVFVVRDMAKGDVFTKETIRTIRPANGLAPKHYASLLGKRSSTALKAGTPLAQTHVEGGTLFE